MLNTVGPEQVQPSAKLAEALEGVKALVELAKREEARQSNPSKTVPKVLNPGLTIFACLLASEAAADPSIRDKLLDKVGCNWQGPLYDYCSQQQFLNMRPICFCFG